MRIALWGNTALIMARRNLLLGTCDRSTQVAHRQRGNFPAPCPMLPESRHHADRSACPLRIDGRRTSSVIASQRVARMRARWQAPQSNP